MPELPVKRYECALSPNGLIHREPSNQLADLSMLEPEFILRELLELSLGSDEVLDDDGEVRGRGTFRFWGRPAITLDFINEWGFVTGIPVRDPSPFEGRWGVRPVLSNDTDDPEARDWIEIAIALRSVQELVRFWIDHKDGRSDEGSRWGLPVDAQWAMFAAKLTHLLDGATPFVVTSFSPRLADTPRGLRAALAAQLYNLVVEDLPINTCAYTKCRRRFVRQRGGAKHNQHRLEPVIDDAGRALDTLHLHRDQVDLSQRLHDALAGLQEVADDAYERYSTIPKATT